MRDTSSILPLQIRGLELVRDGRRLLDIPAVDIRSRRRTVVIGPNGAGKTLFLKLCHGLIEPTAGRIERGAAAIGPDHRRRQAMVFQKAVILRRSVFANVTHALGIGGIGWFERRRRARETLDQFGLSALARRPARVLSGGEQQRLAIARAAGLDPELLFLDEPTSALDPSACRRVEEMLEVLFAKGMTIVLTTHDLGLARRLADDVLFIHGGRVLEQSDAASFFDGPRTPEARAFLESRLFW